ncbi:MAG: DUF4845 domain-containing protein [Proteobacteria bacterium]|uniref:DUF4845 domain-containing protein n=1 Tax=Zoogloea sp. TaxID=49181 RepID=UPI0035B07F17|nr:DUF4845 domain-containing protein [Pseudomonadota bacterium]
MTRKRQSGLSLIGVLLVGALLGACLLVAFKMVPVVSEYFGIKRAISAVAAGADPMTATVTQLRSDFSRRAIVDEISSISAADLDITKENGHIVISVEYSRKVPLVSNVSLLVDFSARSASK